MQAYQNLGDMLLHMPALKSLDIHNWDLQLCKASHPALHIFESDNAALPNIETLTLGDAMLPQDTASVATCLARCSTLRNLHLEHGAIALLNPVQGIALTQLTGVVLRRAEGWIEDVRAVFGPRHGPGGASGAPEPQLAGLRSVQWSGAFRLVDRHHAHVLSAALAQLSAVTSLCLEDEPRVDLSEPGGDGVALPTVLEKVTALHQLARLQLRSHALVENNTAQAVAAVLQSCTTLTRLELVDCEITAEWLTWLAEAVKAAQEVHRSEGGGALKGACLQQLAVLKLDSSAIRPDGAAALARLLQCTSKLQRLSLKVCFAAWHPGSVQLCDRQTERDSCTASSMHVSAGTVPVMSRLHDLFVHRFLIGCVASHSSLWCQCRNATCWTTGCRTFAKCWRHCHS